MQHAKIDPIYHEFANKFVEMIPVEWDRILFYSEAREGANSIHYVFYESSTGLLKDSDSLTNDYGMDRKSRKMHSVGLSRLVTKLRNAFEEEGLEKWNFVTFILESTGKFKFDYEYLDLEASDVVERRKEWEAKHLNA